MTKKVIIRLLVMAVILFVTCETGLRIRLAYLYRNPEWLFYHQFRFRSEDEINAEDLPHYYKENMFKPFKLVYREEDPKKAKEIITIESSALRSTRRQLEQILKSNGHLSWNDYSPGENKEIKFSNNDIVLYELLVYPDIYNTLKRETRIFKKIFGPMIDDFLYHNFAFYMHIDENVNFTTMNQNQMLKNYIELLKSREEPFCKVIARNKYKNVIYVMLPNKFDHNSQGGKIYLKYIKAAHETMLQMLNEYNVPYIDLMDEEVTKGDFTDFFHFSPEGGRKMSYRILDYLNKKGLSDAF